MGTFFKRLSIRLYLVVSLCFTTAILVLILVSVQIHERSLIVEAEANLTQVAKVFQASLDVILSTRRQALHNMADNLQRWTTNEHPSLHDDAALRELFDHLWVVNVHGRVVDEWPRLGAVREGLNLSDTPIFTRVKAGEAFVITPPQPSYYNNEHVIHAVVPMFNIDQQFYGAVVGIFSLRNNDVLNRIVTTRIGEHGYVAITDLDGYIIGHPDRAFIGRQLVKDNSPLLYMGIDQGWQGIGRAPDVYGGEVLQAIQPLNFGHWLVSAQVSLAEALEPARVVRNAQWLLGGLALALTLLILPFILRSYLRPISRLREEVMGVHQGNLKCLSEPHIYELKQLVFRFNSLLDKNAATEANLRQRQAYLDQILATSSAGLFMANAQGKIQYVNQRMVDMTGYAATELIENGFVKHVCDTHRESFIAKVQHSIAQILPCKVELPLRHNGEGLVWLRIETTPVLVEEQCVGHVGTVTDVTSARKKLEELRNAASQDILTGVLNRRGIETELEKIFKASTEDDTPLIALMIDLDNFKRVNDSHGHAYGDYVLTEIGRLMRSFTRDTDALGRIGGDEFVIVLPNCPLSRAEQLAEGLIRSVAKQASSDPSKQYVSLSIGISQRQAQDRSYTDVLSRADSAAYQAKHAGGNQWQLA